MAWPFEDVIAEVVSALVRGEFGVVVANQRSRLTADEIRGAIKQYGRTLVNPPNPGAASIDVIPIKGSQPPAFSVRVPLWTVEEGRSDLILELTIVQGPSGYVAEVDDIHVL